MRVPIKGTKYSRDLDNMAVLCNDLSQVRKYNLEMAKLQEQKMRDQKVASLEADIAEIKTMLRQLMERG